MGILDQQLVSRGQLLNNTNPFNSFDNALGANSAFASVLKDRLGQEEQGRKIEAQKARDLNYQAFQQQQQGQRLANQQALQDQRIQGRVDAAELVRDQTIDDRDRRELQEANVVQERQVLANELATPVSTGQFNITNEEDIQLALEAQQDVDNYAAPIRDQLQEVQQIKKAERRNIQESNLPPGVKRARLRAQDQRDIGFDKRIANLQNQLPEVGVDIPKAIKEEVTRGQTLQEQQQHLSTIAETADPTTKEGRDILTAVGKESRDIAARIKEDEKTGRQVQLSGFKQRQDFQDKVALQQIQNEAKAKIESGKAETKKSLARDKSRRQSIKSIVERYIENDSALIGGKPGLVEAIDELIDDGRLSASDKAFYLQSK